MTGDTPLPTLLSQLLVAFTIEFDNEAEHRMPHRTSAGPAAGSRRGPWLVSQVMWADFLQFLGDGPVPLREVEALARMTNLAGLQRWGYIDVEPDPADNRPKPPRRDWLVSPTRAGCQARQVWTGLAEVIEDRWRARFGAPQISAVRESLGALIGQFELELPPYLPVVTHRLFTEIPDLAGRIPAAGPDLSVLLSRALIAFTLDYEQASPLSLPVSANALRVLDVDGVRVRGLPGRTGVSKEALRMSLGVLTRAGYARVEPDPTAARGKLARLTPEGRAAHEDHRRRLTAVERGWQEHFGADANRALRTALQAVRAGPLAEGLRPYPDGWRAARPYATHTEAVIADPRATLPQHPMVLHRGGWPDGS